MKKVVVIGGGTGNFTVLSGLKKYEVDLSAIVSMADEKNAGNKLPISDLLQNYIKLGSQKDKRILLFLNKKAQSGLLIHELYMNAL